MQVQQKETENWWNRCLLYEKEKKCFGFGCVWEFGVKVIAMSRRIWLVKTTIWFAIDTANTISLEISFRELELDFGWHLLRTVCCATVLNRVNVLRVLIGVSLKTLKGCLFVSFGFCPLSLQGEKKASRKNHTTFQKSLGITVFCNFGPWPRTGVKRGDFNKFFSKPYFLLFCT